MQSTLPQDLGEETWTGWQFHDPGDGSGAVILVRKPDSAYRSAEPRLHGIDVTRTYEVENVATGEIVTMPGERLAAGVEVVLAEAGSSLVWRYRPAQ